MANPERRGLYMYPKTVLTIDNGQDKVSIDRGVVAERIRAMRLKPRGYHGFAGSR